MKCNSCSLEIPPEFSHAITNNFCPRCGKTLMDETTQELMVGLAEALKVMSDPISIVSWLMSNYTLKKIGEYEPVVTKQNNKVVKRAVSAEPETKYNSIIEQIHKSSGLDKSKTISSKKVLEDREGGSSKESLVTMGPETSDDEDVYSQEESLDSVDEIDEMMTSTANIQGSNKSLDLVVQEIKMKQAMAKDNILGGALAKNSFSRSS